MSKDLRTIKSAHRVLEILEYFDREHRTATVMDLSRSLGYPQSSTSELLRYLTRLGYLHYNRFRRTYSPTARVALLGSWVEPTLFRGGTVLRALDDVAESVGETVVLSTAVNYVVQHLHVVDGSEDHAVVEHAGRCESLLHSSQGRLILSSYQDGHIRSALHRLNAEEEDPARRVRITETVAELIELRRTGWLIQPEAREDGAGLVAVLLPPRKGLDRLALSVLAPREVIEARADEILRIMLEQRDGILPDHGTADLQRMKLAAPQSSGLAGMMGGRDVTSPQPVHA
jgi:IclR family transcriptional regulator, KDG regulon repressor